MKEDKGYILGQSPTAARRLELQDEYFSSVSERLLDLLALRPSDRVVELGCGPGSFSHRVLRRLGPEGVLVGVDSSEGLLREARARLAKQGPARFETVQADVTTLEPWLTQADVVLGRFVLHHIPMVEFMLGRLLAKLRPGTKLGFLEPDTRTPLAHLAHQQATVRPDLAPLLVWAETMNKLFLSNRISPDIGGTLAGTLQMAGYRNVRSEWLPNPPIPIMIENMIMLYDEIREVIAARGILSSEEATEQQRLLRGLSLEGAPAVWGSYWVVCEV
jgi:ubiquinone/menaquinone biosynthesis C-methylase UbiE